jgi:hypothetical protein
MFNNKLGLKENEKIKLKVFKKNREEKKTKACSITNH